MVVGNWAWSVERRRQWAMLSMLGVAFPLSGLALLEFRALNNFHDANAALVTQQQASAALANGVQALDPTAVGRAIAAAGRGGPRLPAGPALVVPPVQGPALAVAPVAPGTPAPPAIVDNPVPFFPAAGGGGAPPGGGPGGGGFGGGGGITSLGGGGGGILIAPTPTPTQPAPTPSPTSTTPSPSPSPTTPEPSPSPSPSPTSTEPTPTPSPTTPAPTPTSSPTPVSPLPEPETWLLMGAGAAMGSWWLRKKRGKRPTKG